MTCTLGYRDPETGRDFIIDVGDSTYSRDEEQGGYWAVEYLPETGESTGPMFFATDADIQSYGDPSTTTEWQKVAEAARKAHHLAAGQDDAEIYDRSQAAFLAALNAAYPWWADPTGDHHPLYNLWVDSMEDLTYYVREIARGAIDVNEWYGR